MDIKPETLNLARAFNEEHLCGVHIDLQSRFYNAQTRQAYIKANRLAETMRVFKVPNVWTAFLAKNPSILTLAEMGKIGFFDILHPRIDVLNDEALVSKINSDAFSSGHLKTYLDTQSISSIVITGVLYSRCFQATVRGALKAGFTVYACLDATNCLPEGYDEFKSNFFSDITQKQQSNLYVTATGEVIDTFFRPN